MSSPARLGLARMSLAHYRWMKRRWRGRIAAAFCGTTAGPGARGEWAPLSRWLANGPARERIMMMVGPRWNTAAVLALTPAFDVRAGVVVDAGDIDGACAHWTAVVYDERLRTVAALGRRSVDDTGGAAAALAPGRYFLALRCYEPGAEARFPAVRADGGCVVAARDVAEETTAYAAALRALAGRRHRVYRLMHYHAYAMLRERDRFDEATLRRHYLPVGNPETGFAFGAVAPGERLRVKAPAAGARAYVTFYGIDSIPCAWGTVDADGGVTAPAPEHGTYLVRCLDTGAAGGAADPGAERLS